MNNFKIWFSTVTFGETKKYTKLFLWNFLDSFVVTIPYAVMVLAVYLLLIPVAHSSEMLPLNRLWILCGVLLAQTIVYGFIRRRTYIKICVGFAQTTKKARISMGEHLRTLSMGFFSKRDAGDLSTVLLRDYTEMENLASGLIPQVSVILVRLIISIIVLSAFDWRMVLAVILTIPMSLPFAIISYKRMGKISDKLLKTQQEAASRILEYVGGIQTLKAFNQAGEHFRILKETFLNQSKHSKRMELAAAPIGMIGRFILNCGIGIVMLCGVWLLTGGEMSPFYYIVFLLLSLNIYEPIMTVFAFIADYARTNGSAQRICTLNNEKPLLEPKNSLPISGTEIIFKDVSFSYGDKEVLHNVSFSIPPKGLTALVGPSGSGKSTIVKLVARFWDVDKGEIIIGGVPVAKIKNDHLLSKISMVFQDVYLFHDTIESNIRMGNSNATMDEVVEAAKKAACHQFISALPQGYNTLVGEGGSTLSGGEKQRISIARALLKNAPIVLLDEATASLDPENQILIQQAISALVEDKTVIVIAHRLQSIRNAQQIIVLDSGEIRERGSHDTLLKKGGMYDHLWEEQSRAGSWRLMDSIVN
ncbi:ABC transporter ATP-binding protein [Clostridium kluyveri]|uniref:ABC transporter ATP-binding protein n=1 Tax=Clostridium kluyveri TaxID=1534 RepID=UPI000B28D2F2|nr:ABC transporter ATP-binding protein [Clostridium kluyveri]UZQ51785.1 ABC transporter ATP-binding protein/permease [Clostridium kluyveri]